MARTRPPRVPEEPVRLVTEETVRRLLRSCEGRAFIDRRDAAMIRLLLLLHSGARRSEVAALTVGAIDLREKIATVVGKGRRSRIITFGLPTALALDRYLPDGGCTATRSDPVTRHGAAVAEPQLGPIYQRGEVRFGVEGRG